LPTFLTCFMHILRTVDRCHAAFDTAGIRAECNFRVLCHHREEY